MPTLFMGSCVCVCLVIFALPFFVCCCRSLLLLVVLPRLLVVVVYRCRRPLLLVVVVCRCCFVAVLVVLVCSSLSCLCRWSLSPLRAPDLGLLAYDLPNLKKAIEDAPEALYVPERPC